MSDKPSKTEGRQFWLRKGFQGRNSGTQYPPIISEAKLENGTHVIEYSAFAAVIEKYEKHIGGDCDNEISKLEAELAEAKAKNDGWFCMGCQAMVKGKDVFAERDALSVQLEIQLNTNDSLFKRNGELVRDSEALQAQLHKAKKNGFDMSERIDDLEGERDAANESANNLANDNLNLSGMNYHYIQEIEELAKKLQKVENFLGLLNWSQTAQPAHVTGYFEALRDLKRILDEVTDN